MSTQTTTTNTPDTTHPAEKGMRSTVIGIVLNSILAAIKGAAGVFGNSYALVADAIESASDVFSSIMVWWGLKIAIRPPDEDHPQGHGKAEPLTTLGVALALFVASFFIATHSIQEIKVPHKMPAPFTLVVLAVVVIIKEGLFRYVFQVGEEVGSSAVKGDAWHHRSDALTSTAAFIGISIALLGGKGWESADDWAALFAAGIIAFNGFYILRGAIYELTDAAPDAAIETQVREIASTVEGVVGLHRCNVRKMGFDFYVELDVIVDRVMPVYQAHDIAHRVQDTIRETNPRIARVLVHTEPSKVP